MSQERFLSGFWEGATRPSALAVGVAVATTIGWFGACAALLHPRVLATYERYFATGSHDITAFLPSKLSQLSAAPPGEPMVVILGGSATGFALSPSDLQTRLSTTRTRGRPVLVVSLFLGNLTFWEAGAMVERLPPGARGLLVLDVGPMRFTRDSADLADELRRPRLAFRSAALDREVRLMGIAPPRRTGNFFLDNHRYLLARLPFLARNLLWGGYDPCHWGGTDCARASRWKAGEVAGRSRDYPAHLEANLGVLERVVAAARAHTAMQVVLLEGPINPRFVAELGPGILGRYHQAVRGFASRSSVPYWDLSDEASLVETDFLDWTHLHGHDAMARFNAAFARRAAEALEGSGHE